MKINMVGLIIIWAFRRSFSLGIEAGLLLELCFTIFMLQGCNMIGFYYFAKDNELQIFFKGGDLLLSEVK